jgi:hypothetical protein
MLAPLVIDLLYICVLMLVSGWVYDILHASSHLGRRDSHLATGLPFAKIGRKCAGADRKAFHA